MVFSQTASIKGRIIDHQTGEVVKGCYITCLNTTFKTYTDEDGEFVLNNLPPGQYDVQVESVGFAETNSTDAFLPIPKSDEPYVVSSSIII